MRTDLLKKIICPVLCGLLLLPCACGGASVSAPAEAGTPAVSAAAVPETEVFTFEFTEEAAATPAPTPVPTPAATPDPASPYGTWTGAENGVTVCIGTDGTFTLTDGDGTGSAPCAVTESAFVFTLASGGTVTMPYTVTDGVMTVSQSGQTDLVLTRTESASTAAETVTAPAEDGEPDPFILLWADRAVVTVETAEDAAIKDYCFTAVRKVPAADSPDWAPAPGPVFSVYKSDGTFYVWLRDETGTVYGPREITVSSGFTYPIKAEGLRALSTPLESYAAEHGTSADELTAAVWSDAGRAGLYTRAGVVTSGISLVSHMAGMGASVTYQGHGAFQDEDDWGVNPQWGAKLQHPTSDGNGTYRYAGMQCVAAIVWAYKQAGVNLSNKAGSAIGTLGEQIKSHDNVIKYKEARSGDIIKQNGHYLMVVDRLDTDRDGADDTYLTYEMNAPHLTCLKLTFQQVRYREFFSMDGVFTNEGRRRKNARFWEDTFFIPEEALPDGLRSAASTGDILRAAARLGAVLDATR